MKNLAKIFMMVAALFAFACTTDVTEDLGVQIGDGAGQTTITLSLEESRTQLGEKAGDLYPLYWSEGDAVVVNGQVSNALTAEQAGSAGATFSFAEVVARPWCVVYPAPAAVAAEEVVEGEGETTPATVYPVNFLAAQPYTVGTFAPQAAPMYGYGAEAAEGEEAPYVQLQHLTGVLRLAVKGSVTLASVNVEAEGKIAGAFTVDCATGALVAEDSASNVVSVVLPEEGLVLNAEKATPIYVAVPAGQHGIYTVTLVSTADTENTMVVRFNSDYHPVEAGVVKEFAEFEFQANASNAQEGELVIVNAAQMKRLAQLSEVGQLGNVNKVTIGAVIDMSQVDWAPINLFPSNIVFDGGNFEISGLKAPLFNSTAATIKNVKLTGVNIVETENPQVGAIARSFFGTMTDCSATGTLVVNNTTFTTTASMDIYNVIDIGGLVGIAGGATFENCENKVNVTIKSVAAEELDPSAAIGGAVGAAHSGSSFTNVDNYGGVTIDVRETTISLRVGGIIGIMLDLSEDAATAPDVKLVTKCDNHGAITTTKETTGLSAVQFGGIASIMTYGITNFSYNHNHGAITFNDGGGSRRAGGIVATHSYSVIDNCTNNAPITNNGAAGATFLGGIIGGDVLAAITNCTNSAEGVIRNSGELTGTNNFYAGGITASDLEITHDNYVDYGYTAEDCHITNCHNHGEVIHDGSCNSIFLAGICARTTSANISRCTNTAAVKHIGVSKNNAYIAGICGRSCNSVSDCSNSAAITVGGERTLASGTLYTTGIAGTTNEAITDCENTGAITVNGDAANTTKFAVNVAGVVSVAYHKISDCSNSGSISISNMQCSVLRAAGIVNTTYAGTTAASSYKWQKLENSGDITLHNLGGWVGNTNCYIAGLVGYLHAAGSGFTTANRVELYNCKNTGDITGTSLVPGLASGTSGKEGRTIAGGCFAHQNVTYYDWNNCDNEGDLSLEIAVSSHTFIAGLSGYIAQGGGIAELTCVMQNCDNSGNITINSVKRPATDTPTAAGEGFLVGGMYGGWYHATANVLQTIKIKQCTNSGNVVLKGNNMAVTGRHLIGGISADHYASATFINCHNSGAVGMEGVVDTEGAKISTVQPSIGGIVAYIHPYRQIATDINNISYCTNSGKIYIKNIQSSGYIIMGGIVGYNQERKVSASNLDNCSNSGELSVENSAAKSGSSFAVGGIVGYSADKECTFSGEFVNTGEITISGSTGTATTYIGGVLGFTNKPISNAKSYCDIKAIGLEGKVGMIMGIARADATLASGCGIGGSLVFEQKQDKVYDDEAGVYIPGKIEDVIIPLSSSNYLNFVYAGDIPAASDEEATLLPSKPTVTNPSASTVQ